MTPANMGQTLKAIQGPVVREQVKVSSRGKSHDAFVKA